MKKHLILLWFAPLLMAGSCVKSYYRIFGKTESTIQMIGNRTIDFRTFVTSENSERRGFDGIFKNIGACTSFDNPIAGHIEVALSKWVASEPKGSQIDLLENASSRGPEEGLYLGGPLEGQEIGGHSFCSDVLESGVAGDYQFEIEGELCFKDGCDRFSLEQTVDAKQDLVTQSKF